MTMYGGEPVLYSTDYRNAFDVKALEKYLEKDHDFKYAALVHCDTPSGMLNDVSKLCPLLKKYGYPDSGGFGFCHVRRRNACG